MLGTVVLGLIAFVYVILAYMTRKQGSNAVSVVCIVIALVCVTIALALVCVTIALSLLFL